MSQRTIISQPNLRIYIETGTEGPRHDPYAFEEFTIERNGHKIMLHSGLGDWMEIEDEKVDNVFVNDTFVHFTGHTPDEWRRFIEKLERHRWRRHRSHDVRNERGYPGEHFTYCRTCDQMIDNYFNLSEVI